MKTRWIGRNYSREQRLPVCLHATRELWHRASASIADSPPFATDPSIFWLITPFLRIIEEQAKQESCIFKGRTVKPLIPFTFLVRFLAAQPSVCAAGPMRQHNSELDERTSQSTMTFAGKPSPTPNAEADSPTKP